MSHCVHSLSASTQGVGPQDCDSVKNGVRADFVSAPLGGRGHTGPKSMSAVHSANYSLNCIVVIREMYPPNGLRLLEFDPATTPRKVLDWLLFQSCNIFPSPTSLMPACLVWPRSFYVEEFGMFRPVLG